MISSVELCHGRACAGGHDISLKILASIEGDAFGTLSKNIFGIVELFIFVIVAIAQLIGLEYLDVDFGSCLRLREWIFVDVLMSSRGGPRTGSGRKKIHVSFAEGVKFWQRGHWRIWLDCQIYSSWVSAKIYCGYRSDSAFAGHLLSLERRRR